MPPLIYLYLFSATFPYFIGIIVNLTLERIIFDIPMS